MGRAWVFPPEEESISAEATAEGGGACNEDWVQDRQTGTAWIMNQGVAINNDCYESKTLQFIFVKT